MVIFFDIYSFLTWLTILQQVVGKLQFNAFFMSEA
tara:strand:- start:141 stop:245 length:105 start_codon:yes stop_codon:yes gene_type:complete